MQKKKAKILFKQGKKIPNMSKTDHLRMLEHGNITIICIKKKIKTILSLIKTIDVSVSLM